MPDNAIFQVTEVELTYRNQIPPEERIKVNSCSTAYEMLKRTWDENRIELVEEFKVMLLSQNNTCLGIAHIATGGGASCPVDPKIVFATALRANASGIILAHNHPSGSLKASKEDCATTRKICAGAELFGIEVLDHLILTQGDYMSMAKAGLMPSGNNQKTFQLT